MALDWCTSHVCEKNPPREMELYTSNRLSPVEEGGAGAVAVVVAPGTTAVAAVVVAPAVVPVVAAVGGAAGGAGGTAAPPVRRWWWWWCCEVGGTAPKENLKVQEGPMRSRRRSRGSGRLLARAHPWGRPHPPLRRLPIPRLPGPLAAARLRLLLLLLLWALLPMPVPMLLHGAILPPFPSVVRE